MFKDTKDGQTYSWNDGCGEKEHNSTEEKIVPPIPGQDSWEEDFYDVLPIVCSPLTADSKVAHIKTIFEVLLTAAIEKEREEWMSGERCYNCGKEMERSETTNMCAECWED